MYGVFKFFCKPAVNAILLVICLWLPCRGQDVAGSGVLQPLPDLVAGAPGTVVDTPLSPVVTYRDGVLTIDAQNSTLAEVLKLVAEKTGAVIDVPPGTGLDRIVEHTGPGSTEDVLTGLLNGSPFDFVIVGSSQRPHDPMQVLLFPRGADTLSGKQDAVALATSANGQEPQLYGAAFRVDPSTENSVESPQSVAVSASQPPQAASGDAIPGAVLGQLLKERLRQRQEMQQQPQTNQQQSNSSNSQ
jgi:hypothetical protein